MRLISHRGNINGKNLELENKPEYIMLAKDLGYDVEIDIWVVNNNLYLGHDEPIYLVERDFISQPGLWCHAKNSDALQYLNNTSVNYFWHNIDDYTLTSKNIVWVYPNKPLLIESVCVLPELGYNGDITKCYGICSDFIENFNNYV